MIPINLIREEADLVISRLRIKGLDAEAQVSQIVELDKLKRAKQVELNDLQAHSNQLNAELGALFKEGKQEEALKKKDEAGNLKQSIKALEHVLSNSEKSIQEALLELPNIPHDSVPEGKSAEDNELILEEGSTPEFGFEPLAHWDLAKKYNLIDFELGNKISGAGFPVYIGMGAKLQRALISYFLDKALEEGYVEYMPPLMINEASGYGTGQLPDKEGQMYHITEDNLFLIPTAEVPLTNIVRDEIIEEKKLPLKMTGYTPCFRREAGSYGKDVRGLNRLHQFDKVEIVQVQTPEKSYETLEEMKDYVAGLLRELGLQFRIVKLCGGDMSFTAALTYDFEVYSAAQKKWLEVSSVSNFESYQSNRLKLRYRNKEGKNELAHTLNGSALALPRIVASILENFQQKDCIAIPKVLHKYCGSKKIDFV